MPNRIIKESICTSGNLNDLSPEEEVFFYRLIVSCDDFGRLDARAPILRAKCFPLKLNAVNDESVTKWLKALQLNKLIRVYLVDRQPYLEMVTWEKHQQVRNHRSKYPAPPDGSGISERPSPDESDIEDLLFAHLSDSKQFNGEQLISVDRQVRVGESYLDIVAKGTATYVFELKRGRLSNKSLSQLCKYLEKTPGRGLLIGSGLAANFDLTTSEIAVITYDDESLTTKVISKPIWLTSGITLFNVIQRETKLASNPYPIQSLSLSLSEARANARARETPSPKKESYGEFENVLLSDDEHQKLTEKLGKSKTDDLIEQLSGYMKQSPANAKKYKDHYATILNWSRRDDRKDDGQLRQDSKAFHAPKRYTRPEEL